VSALPSRNKITLIDDEGASIYAEDETVFRVLTHILKEYNIDPYATSTPIMPTPTPKPVIQRGAASNIPRHLLKRGVPDLPDDGYRWRKYGQKMAQSSTAILFRDYYRCPHPNCASKKQVLFDGQTGEIVSINMTEHNHEPEPIKPRSKAKRGSSAASRATLAKQAEQPSAPTSNNNDMQQEVAQPSVNSQQIVAQSLATTAAEVLTRMQQVQPPDFGF